MPLSVVSAAFPRPPILNAAGLPSARWRCDHFTTLATLIMNVLAAERQD
jgi:hypothetical protein